MAQVLFYEKPGCINNTKQKAWLDAAGHEVTVENILETQWTPDELRLYFGDKPVSDWFNTTAPRVKSGEVLPHAFGSEEALALMVKEPILIRRPLIRVGDRRMQGFNENEIHEWIGLGPSEGKEAIVEKLKNDKLSTCPMLDKDSCDEQALIPEKPLSLMMEITDAIGLEVTYEYDDLVFVSNNIFIYRFTQTRGEVDIFFNQDCDTYAKQQLMESLVLAAKSSGITLTERGCYTLSQAEGENISIAFSEFP